MREADLEPFVAMLDSVCSLLSRGAYQPSASNSAMFFRALAKYEMADVRKALDAHVTDPVRGRFVPTPADVMAQIEGHAADDGRPGADEAWAIAICAADEFDTVCWTQEMAEAWGTVLPVFESGDQIGARMAFRGAYDRLVAVARGFHRRPVWTVSEGFDVERRRLALTRAAELGRIAVDQLPLLAGPEQPVALLADAVKAGAPKHAVEAIERFKRAAAARKPLQWAHDLKAREERGEHLTEQQAKAWRIAIERAPAKQAVGDFNPIPPEALPPTMRKKTR